MRRNKWQALTITRLTQSLYTTQDRSAGTSEKHPITPWWWTHPSPYQTHLLSTSHKWSLVHNHNRSHSMLRRPKLRSLFQLIACGGTRHSPVRHCHRCLAGPSAKTCSRGSTAKQVFLWIPTLYILSSRHIINTEEIPSYHPVSTSNQIWQCYLTWSHKSDKCGPITSIVIGCAFALPLCWQLAGMEITHVMEMVNLRWGGGDSVHPEPSPFRLDVIQTNPAVRLVREQIIDKCLQRYLCGKNVERV